jgi:hypothetical protein
MEGSSKVILLSNTLTEYTHYKIQQSELHHIKLPQSLHTTIKTAECHLSPQPTEQRFGVCPTHPSQHFPRKVYLIRIKKKQSNILRYSF